MKISVITVVRDNKDFIGWCIESVINQTHADIEYIVIDGASTDGTLAVIDKYRDRISRIVSEKDNGLADAMNKGIGIATGEVIGFLHSDDFYVNDSVIKKVAASFELNDIDSLYGDLVYVGKNDIDKIVRYWRGGRWGMTKMKIGWMPAHPTFFVRKKIYDRYGYFDVRFKIAADYENILRLLYKHNISTYYLPEIIVKMRFGGMSNKGLKNIIKKSAEDYKACRMHGLGVSAVIMKNILKLPQFLIK